jgi:hypothetical protein
MSNRRVGVGLVVALGVAAYSGYQAISARRELNKFKDAVATQAVTIATTAQVHTIAGTKLPLVPECLPTESRIQMDMVSLPIVIQSGKAPQIMPETGGEPLVVKLTLCSGEEGLSLAVSPPIMSVAAELAKISGRQNAIDYVDQAAEMRSTENIKTPLPDECQPPVERQPDPLGGPLLRPDRLPPTDKSQLQWL